MLEVYSFFLLALSSHLISNKSLLSQGTGYSGTEETARLTGLFTGLVHKHVWHIAISHSEFGVQFKVMLVNALPKGCIICLYNHAGGDCMLSRSYEEAAASSLFSFWRSIYDLYKLGSVILKLMIVHYFLARRKLKECFSKQPALPRLCWVHNQEEHVLICWVVQHPNGLSGDKAGQSSLRKLRCWRCTGPL